MQILSIGNSFSQDATRYLHQIAKADGVKLTTVNLYIGGCNLFRHFQNIKSDARAYSLEINGENTGFSVSVKEALLSREWDVVTLQQVSKLSPDFETFQPYLSALADYVREYAPKAKIYMHQTWGYEENSPRLNETMGYASHLDMFKDLENSYAKAKEAICGDGIIPSGKTFCKLTEKGIPNIHRDTSHASFGLGRYALGLTWYKTLTGNSVLSNTFSDFDCPVSEEEIKIAKTCVESL